MTHKTKWVLQDVGLSNVLLDDNFITCKQLNLPYVGIGTIPFTSIFTNLEKLYFQNPALSKRLNRIIQNFGLSRIKVKFQELGKLRGFKVFHLSTSYKVACR